MALIDDSRSVTVQVTVTSPTYQPLVPNGPVTVGEMTGGVGSWTVTWNVTDARLSWVSDDEQVTLDVPGMNAEPEAGLQTTATEPSTVSTAVGIVQLAGVP